MPRPCLNGQGKTLMVVNVGPEVCIFLPGKKCHVDVGMAVAEGFHDVSWFQWDFMSFPWEFYGS